MGHPVGVAIPIAGVAGVALDFVDDGVNPCGGGIVFVGLDNVVGGIPSAGDGEVHCAEKFEAGRVHEGKCVDRRSGINGNSVRSAF